MWIKRKHIIQIDIDGTLISEDLDLSKPSIDIDNPFSKGEIITLNPIQENIDLISKIKDLGFSITVHSAGGLEWVEAVLKALNITPDMGLIDEIADKPVAVVDDLDPNHWIKHRVFEAKEPRAGSNWMTAKSLQSLMEDLEDHQIPKK